MRCYVYQFPIFLLFQPKNERSAASCNAFEGQSPGKNRLHGFCRVISVTLRAVPALPHSLHAGAQKCNGPAALDGNERCSAQAFKKKKRLIFANQPFL